MLPSSSGTSRGHLSRLKWRSKIITTERLAEVPGNGGFSGGAAYRNRTDDLRITSASLWPTELRRLAVLADDAWLVYRYAGVRCRVRRQPRDNRAVRLTEADARSRLGSARVARLATVGADGQPHVVPVTFAVDGDLIYTAVDDKPKTTPNLRRLRNIAHNPRVAILADHYSEDWDSLWWVRVDGRATVLENNDAVKDPLDKLAQRYQQYRQTRPTGPVIVIEAERWTGWASGQGRLSGWVSPRGWSGVRCCGGSHRAVRWLRWCRRRG
jgi:PPOX class probable F420-dependent enzyme